MDVIIIYSVTETKVGKWGNHCHPKRFWTHFLLEKKKQGIEGYWVNHAQASKQAKCVLCYD